MRISTIHNLRLNPPRGGNHVHALQIAKAFIRDGHEVLTIGDDSVREIRSFPDSSEGYEQIDVEAEVHYVRVDARLLSNWPHLCSLLRRTSKPVVWEINSPANENLAFSWLGGRSRPKREPWQSLDRARRWLHALRQTPTIAREEALRRQLAQKVSAATCVSESMGRYAREALGIEDVRVIPNGADHHFFVPRDPMFRNEGAGTGPLRVVYAGSPIYPWQGLDVLAETMRLCASAGDPITFDLLFNQASVIPLEGPNVNIAIGVRHDLVPDRLRAAEVALSIQPDFPWSPWGFHGSPMKLFDYMACGLPVVVSAVGQLAEVIEDGVNGAHFDNSPESLREVLLRLYANRDRLSQMGRAARSAVERHYNWDVIGAQTLAVLGSVTR